MSVLFLNLNFVSNGFALTFWFTFTLIKCDLFDSQEFRLVSRNGCRHTNTHAQVSMLNVSISIYRIQSTKQYDFVNVTQRFSMIQLKFFRGFRTFLKLSKSNHLFCWPEFSTKFSFLSFGLTNYGLCARFGVYFLSISNFKSFLYIHKFNRFYIKSLTRNE